ncbi:hypothetical protein ORV05_10315 [Amycolatopsis cynarae]|uniref:Uncharacterized protein n=1 Tax=Amycolatopsis cynarae TaxID=2995223 RepID=A0ABY7B901_9PSEU|nr:hypothetical protein [Amycolatopsis sp. HUAS 11-8]WAL68133.1 hypothetical protein ORV05_10315 [Amycolatopsis sp. HUAS 11-8]
MSPSPVLAAWASGDHGPLSEALAEHVTFSSPVADYHGRGDVAHMLGLIAGVLEGVERTGEWGDERDAVYALVARVGGQDVQGLLREERTGTGELAHITLFLRPYPVLRTAIGRMREALERTPLPSVRG